MNTEISRGRSVISPVEFEQVAMLV